MRKISIVSIALLASILRFYQLGVNPPSLTWDEAAWGYNAYSLGIDGRDEFGRLLPLDYLESFGDFKPPVYAYLTILPVKLFGLTEFATRFASAFFGVLTVVVTFFLVRELLRRVSAHRTNKTDTTNIIALIGAGLLAVSPWHINLSRAAFEANVATFFIVAGIWLFLRTMRIGGTTLILAVLSFALSLYTFNTARIVTPALVVILVVYFRRQVWKMKRVAAISLVIGLVMSIPFVRFMLTPLAALRYHEVNIFSDLSIIEGSNAAMWEDKQYVREKLGKDDLISSLQDRREILNQVQDDETGVQEDETGVQDDDYFWWSRIIHNRRFLYFQSYLKHYFDHFNPRFLFISGDGNPKFSTQDVGQLYLWELPFLLIGLLTLLKKKGGLWWLIPVWILVGIAPAAVARETPHALRIETILPTVQILAGIGVATVLTFLRKLKNVTVQKSLIAVVGLGLFLNIAYYLHGYYVHYPREYAGEWQYGYREMTSFVAAHQDNYDRIVMTTKLGRPYIYTLFYTREDPHYFRQNAIVEREVYGFVHVQQYGKYIFTEDASGSYEPGKTLRIDVPDRIPESAIVVYAVRRPDSKEALVAYE